MLRCLLCRWFKAAAPPVAMPALRLNYPEVRPPPMRVVCSWCGREAMREESPSPWGRGQGEGLS